MRTYVDGEVFATNSENAAPTISMTYASELVENYAVGKVISGADHKRLASIQDEEGHPMTFALTDQEQLILIHKSKDSNHLTGYEEVKLSKPDNQVVAFGVGQNPDLRFNLCKIEINPKNRDTFDFYTVNSKMPKDFLAQSADDNANDWILQTSLEINTEKSGRITQIYVANGNSTNDTLPEIVITSVLKGQAAYHILWPGETEGSGKLESLDLGQASRQIHEIVIGKIGVFSGVYSIQSSDSEWSLRFSTFPIDDYQVHITLGNSENQGPHRFTTLQALPEDADGRTGLYLGGEGVFHLPASEQTLANKNHTFNVISSKKDAPGIKTLTVREDNGNVTLWAHNSQGEMLNIEGSKPATFVTATSGNVPSLWEVPIVIDRGIKAWAPIRNRVKQTNDLMVITQKNAFTHKTQDPATKTWNSMTIPLDDKLEIQKFESYTTQLTFRNERRVALGNHQVEIRASEWCELTANGVAIELHPDKSVLLKTDPLGIITLIFQQETISAPILRVKLSPEAKEWKIVDPAQKIHDKIGGIDTVKKLKAARKQNDKPLLPKDHGRTPEDLANLVKGLQEMKNMKEKLNDDGTVSKNYLAGLSAAEIKVPEIWGMEFGSAGIQYFEADAVYQAFGMAVLPGEDDAEENWWDKAVVRAAGHILNWFKNAAENTIKFVVKVAGEAWDLAIKIGEQAFKFTIDTLGQIYKAINWVLKKVVGIDLEDIRQWAGFLFDLDAIQQTHEVISNVVRQAFPFGLSKVDEVKTKMDDYFKILKSMVNNFGEFPEEAKGKSLDSQKSFIERNMKLEDKNKVKATTEAIQCSPMANYFSQKIQQSGIVNPSKNPLAYFSLLDEPSDALKDALEKVKQLLKDSTKTFEKMDIDLVDLFEGKITLDHLASKLSKKLITTIIDLLQSVMNIVASVMKEIIKLVQSLLTSNIELPLLSILYKTFLKTDSVDIIGVLLLPLSTAITVFSKILTGEAPFHNGTNGMEKMAHKELFALFRGGTDQMQNDVLKVWETICSFVSTQLNAVGKAITLTFTAIQLNAPSVIGACLTFFGIVFSIPLGQWNRAGIVINWIGEWIKLLVPTCDFLIPVELGLTKTIRFFISVIQFVVVCETIIIDIANNKDHGAKLAMSIWGGFNYFINLGNDLILALCAIPAYGGPKEALLLTSGVGINLETWSKLAHNIISALPGVIPDQNMEDNLLPGFVPA